MSSLVRRLQRRAFVKQNRERPTRVIKGDPKMGIPDTVIKLPWPPFFSKTDEEPVNQ